MVVEGVRFARSTRYLSNWRRMLSVGVFIVMFGRSSDESCGQSGGLASVCYRVYWMYWMIVGCSSWTTDILEEETGESNICTENSLF